VAWKQVALRQSMRLRAVASTYWARWVGTGNAVWLARGLADRSLVALRLDPRGGARPGEARLEVSRELDASLPAGWTACPICRKTIQRRRYCPGCGADLHGLEAAAVGGVSASQLVERVVTAAGARYEVLRRAPA
jgi:hypothetical protein